MIHRYKRIWLLLLSLANGCTYSGIFEDLDDFNYGTRFFITSVNFHGDLLSLIPFNFPQCAGNNVSDMANCVCRQQAAVLFPEASLLDQFRAVISTTSRHFVCNLQDKNGSYCDYKIRPGRRIYHISDCPTGQDCPHDLNVAINLQDFLRRVPPPPPINFMAGFDGSLKTQANCVNFTSNNASDNVVFWDSQNHPWPGGTNVPCNGTQPLLCMDKY